MSVERIPMSREGYERLKADVDRMMNIEMIEVAKRIAAARELGDLSENAEYHAAREDQGMLQARIDALKDKLSRAYFVDRATHRRYGGGLPHNNASIIVCARTTDSDDCDGPEPR